MVASCCVFGCKTSTNESVRFFSFPTVRKRFSVEFQNILAARRKAWINATKRKNSDGNIDKLKICSKHFISGEPANFRDTLHPDWIPSVCTGCKKNSDKLPPKKKLERYARALIRNQKRTYPTLELHSNKKSVDEIQNNSEVIIISASDSDTDTASRHSLDISDCETDTASCHSLYISDLSNASEDVTVSLIEADIGTVESRNDTTVPDSIINDQGPPIASLENSRTEETSPVGDIRLLQLEIVSLRAQLIIQKDEIEQKDKEISSLKEQTASLISELNNRCSEVYNLRLKLKPERCKK